MERKKITFDSFIRGSICCILIVGVLMLVERLSGVLLPFFLSGMAHCLFNLSVSQTFPIQVTFKKPGTFYLLCIILHYNSWSYRFLLSGTSTVRRIWKSERSFGHVLHPWYSRQFKCAEKPCRFYSGKYRHECLEPYSQRRKYSQRCKEYSA